MLPPSDEDLVAYLDGELDEVRFVEVEAFLDRDPGLRARLQTLTEATLLVREAYDEILREPIPETLLAAARPRATILSFATAAARRGLGSRRQWVNLAAAASVSALVFGASGYFAGEIGPSDVRQANWLDNIAGTHNLLISSANADTPVFDVPVGSERRLPADIRIPDLKPWGLAFQGARKLVVEGKPAYQFYYTTENKDLGPVTLTVTNSERPDSTPTYDTREGVNLLYWRHQGHGYALVGQTSKGYMWSIVNDIGYQLKAF